MALDPLPDEPSAPRYELPGLPAGEVLFAPLFFDPTLINTIYTTNAAYSARGRADTSNAADMVYNTRTTSGGIAGAQLLLNLAPLATGGYAATFNIDVPAS